MSRVGRRASSARRAEAESPESSSLPGSPASSLVRRTDWEPSPSGDQALAHDSQANCERSSSLDGLSASGELRTSEFAYHLPPDRIARYPTAERADSRLLVLRSPSGQIEHRRFRELPELMAAGDLLVVNDTRVFPARLLGKKPTGAEVEVLLLRPVEGESSLWEALVRPGAKLKAGRVVNVAVARPGKLASAVGPPAPSGGPAKGSHTLTPTRETPVAPELSLRIVESTAEGTRLVRMESEVHNTESEADGLAVLERFGQLPLPPYLGRKDEPLDRERYQTVYGVHEGSVAAPTAGLHFTPELLGELEAQGVDCTALTLHVGPGTFRPVEVEKPSDHRMHAESYNLPGAVVEAHRRCRERGGKVWAVGTTVVRTLESAIDGAGRLRPGAGSTSLFIRPPYRFRAVDCLITNFHLPKSTLLMLVVAFGGIEAVRAAYREAIDAGYRFYSYGDAMAVFR